MRIWPVPTGQGTAGLALSAVGLIVTAWALWQFHIRFDVGAERFRFHSLLFQATHELRNMNDSLCDLATGLYLTKDDAGRPPLPAIPSELSATSDLVSRYRSRLTEHAHAEQGHISYLFFRLFDAARVLEPIRTWEGVVRLNTGSDMSIADTLFLSSFLSWYLKPYAQDTFSASELASLGPRPFPTDDPGSVCKIGAYRQKFFRHDGKPITDFDEYLDLID